MLIRLWEQQVSGGKGVPGRGNRRSKCKEVRGDVGLLENCKELRMATVSNSRWEGAPNTQVQNVWKGGLKIIPLFI